VTVLVLFEDPTIHTFENCQFWKLMLLNNTKHHRAKWWACWRQYRKPLADFSDARVSRCNPKSRLDDRLKWVPVRSKCQLVSINHLHAYCIWHYRIFRGSFSTIKTLFIKRLFGNGLGSHIYCIGLWTLFKLY